MTSQAARPTVGSPQALATALAAFGRITQGLPDRWAQRGTARGAVVVARGDGWERGDPTPLAERVARLARHYRLVWVNPRRGKASYQPLAGGTAACPPYLGDFVAGHSLTAWSSW